MVQYESRLSKVLEASDMPHDFYSGMNVKLGESPAGFTDDASSDIKENCISKLKRS